MENKQDQPNMGTNNASSSNKSSNSSGAGRSNRNTSAASASTEGNTPTAGATQESQPSMGQQDNQPTAGNNSNQESGSNSQRKSWLNQDELLKNINLNQLPQSLKDLGTKAADQVNKLSSTQKIVGGALLVGGLSWLALRSKSAKPTTYTGSSSGSRYTPKGESKWRSSSESVYRGTTSSLQDDANDTGF